MSDIATAGYELWDTQSRNLLDDFDTEAEALAAVRRWIELDGPSSTDALALTHIDKNGRMVTLAMGAELAGRARTAPQRGPLLA